MKCSIGRECTCIDFVMGVVELTCQPIILQYKDHSFCLPVYSNHYLRHPWPLTNWLCLHRLVGYLVAIFSAVVHQHSHGGVGNCLYTVITSLVKTLVCVIIIVDKIVHVWPCNVKIWDTPSVQFYTIPCATLKSREKVILLQCTTYCYKSTCVPSYLYCTHSKLGCTFYCL